MYRKNESSSLFPLIRFFLLFATFSWNQLIFSTQEDGCMYFEDFSLRLYFSVYLLSLFGLKKLHQLYIFNSYLHVTSKLFSFLICCFLSVNFRVFILFFFFSLSRFHPTLLIYMLERGLRGFPPNRPLRCVLPC